MVDWFGRFKLTWRTSPMTSFPIFYWSSKKVDQLAGLRAQGVGWRKISQEMGIGVKTLYRLAGDRSNIREKVS